jgi:hypothetical protein
MKAARATQSAGSYLAHFQPDLQERKRDWDMVLKTFDSGRTVVGMYHQVCLVSRVEDASRCEHSVRAVWRARGFDLTKDFYLQHQALTATLPMTLTPGPAKRPASVRPDQYQDRRQRGDDIPLIAEWKGTQTPVMTLFGRRGQIIGFDLFDNTGGNFNFAVAALSGSGKSVFVNEMTYRYLGAGAKVWIIDVGRSYKNSVRIAGRRVHRVFRRAAEHDLPQPVLHDHRYQRRHGNGPAAAGPDGEPTRTARQLQLHGAGVSHQARLGRQGALGHDHRYLRTAPDRSAIQRRGVRAGSESPGDGAGTLYPPRRVCELLRGRCQHPIRQGLRCPRAGRVEIQERTCNRS